MGWHRADEDARADHFRDSRKHDFPPIDRIERKVTDAEAVAAVVKRVDIEAGAKLIEQFARTFNAGAPR